jgi:calcium-dependent protein kinase
MHKNSIAHRDIKPENILIESVDDLYIKLTDFGFATYFDETDLLDEVLGSPIYMPPEIVNQQKYDSKVDIWSTGVVAYILLCGKPPFFGDSKDQVYASIKNSELNLSSDDWTNVS